MPTTLRAALLLLILACATGCGVVRPASGPPTYGSGRGGDSRA